MYDKIYCHVILANWVVKVQQSVKGYFDVYSLKRIRRLQQRLKGVYCNDALFQRQNLKRKKDIYNDKRLVF